MEDLRTNWMCSPKKVFKVLVWHLKDIHRHSSKSICAVGALSCVSMVVECLFYTGMWKRCLFTVAYMLCLGSGLCLLVRLPCCVTPVFELQSSSHTCAQAPFYRHVLSLPSEMKIACVFACSPRPVWLPASQHKRWYKQEQAHAAPLWSTAAQLTSARIA